MDFSCGVMAVIKFVETENWLMMSVMMGMLFQVMDAAQTAKSKPIINADKLMAQAIAGAE